MKRIASSLLALALLLGLGTLAVLAMPGAGDSVAFVSAQSGVDNTNEVAVVPAAPSAADITLKINEIGLPLDVASAFTAAGLPYDADGLARNIASGLSTVRQVSHWHPGLQQNDTWTPTGPGTGYGVVNGSFTTTPFGLGKGQAYRLLLDNLASTVYSIVGDVPTVGSVTYAWTGGTATQCKLNSFLVPLDQVQSLSGKDLSDADKLATSIGRANVAQVSRWNASLQQSDTWTPTGASGGYGVVNGSFTTTPFAVTIGYPYWICAKQGLDQVVWPQ